MKNDITNKYYTTEIYAALILTLSHTKASNVMHLLGWEVPEQKRDTNASAINTADMLLRLTPKQRDSWAAHRIAESKAEESARQSKRAVEWLEKWAGMTDEDREQFIEAGEKIAEEIDLQEERTVNV
jgi:hypothetical protein